MRGEVLIAFALAAYPLKLANEKLHFGNQQRHSDLQEMGFAKTINLENLLD
jgi:hypothetical protein